MAEVSEANPKLVEDQEEEEARVQMWDYIFGFTKMAVVKCALQLGIAETMENHKEPITLSELSAALKCSSPLLYRIMRFLVYYKFFKEETNSSNEIGYVNTRLSRLLLLKQAENSMHDLFLLDSSHVMLGPWHALSTKVLQKGTSPFKEANGEELWKFSQENPDFSKLFNDAMACDSRQVVPALVQSCSQVFDGIQTLVDVGGGDGTVLSLLVKAFPWILGINFDVSHVVYVAPEYPGVEHVAGDIQQYKHTTSTKHMKNKT